MFFPTPNISILILTRMYAIVVVYLKLLEYFIIMFVSVHACAHILYGSRALQPTLYFKI